MLFCLCFRKAKKNEKYLREEIDEQRQQLEQLEHIIYMSDSAQLKDQVAQVHVIPPEFSVHNPGPLFKKSLITLIS